MDKTVYYSENDTGDHLNEVDITVSETIETAGVHSVLFYCRMVSLQIKGEPMKINLVQVYAPTAENLENEIEHFYKQLK